MLPQRLAISTIDKGMIRIEAPHFTAGVVLGQGMFVIKAPPIVKYMVGWDYHRVMGYCRRKGWGATYSQR